MIYKKKLEAADKCTAGVATWAATAHCLDFVYVIKAADTTHAKIAAAMTKAYYAEKANYDFDKGVVKGTVSKKDAKGVVTTPTATYADVARLTAMLWIGDDTATGYPSPATGAGTEFAAFAVKGGCAAVSICGKDPGPNLPIYKAAITATVWKDIA